MKIPEFSNEHIQPKYSKGDRPRKANKKVYDQEWERIFRPNNKDKPKTKP